MWVYEHACSVKIYGLLSVSRVKMAEYCGQALFLSAYRPRRKMKADERVWRCMKVHSGV